MISNNDTGYEGWFLGVATGVCITIALCTGVRYWEKYLKAATTISGEITTNNPKDIRTFETKCDGNVTYEKLDHISKGAYRVTCWPNNPIALEDKP